MFLISGLMVATGLFSITRSLLLTYVLVNSSQTLHNEMLESILKAPVLFFDRNPIGKSDTKLISKHVLLMHLVPDYIWCLKLEEILRRKSLCMLIYLLHKAFLMSSSTRENLNIEAYKLLFQFMYMWKDKWMFILQRHMKHTTVDANINQCWLVAKMLAVFRSD